MKNKTLRILFLFALIVSAAAYVTPSYATPRQNGIAAAKEIRKRIVKLRKLFNNASVRSAVIAAGVGKSDDSDSDGVPDFMEDSLGSSSCDTDSDDDGIDDGDDSNPDDSGEGELGVTGAITAITSTTVTVGSYTCTVADTSDLGGKSVLTDYLVGDVVELECRLVSSVLTIDSIHAEDGPGHDDDDDS